MLKHFKKLLLLAGLLTAGAIYAVGVEFSYNLAAQGSSSQSLVMGRAAAALDGVDDLDSPWPPNAPTGGTNINYYYFLTGGDSTGTGEYMTVLSKDFRSSANKASTWTLVVDSMAGNSVTLTWSAVSALKASDGSLSLADSSGNTLVADMLKTDSYEFTKTGTYYIYYKDKGVSGNAPATPAEITSEAVFIAANVLTFDMDESIANCVIDSVAFLKGINVPSVDATTTTVTADVKNHKFTVTFGDDVPGDATGLVALYTISNSVGTAQGRISLTSVIASLNLTSATVGGTAVSLADNKVTIDFTDDTKTAYQRASFNYSFAYSTAGAIASFVIALPNEATNWDYSSPDEKVTFTADGSNLTVNGIVISPDPGALADAFTLILTPKCGKDFSPKSGDLTASITFTPDAGEAVVTTSSVSLSVKTAGCLDIDENGLFEKSDVRLLITFYTYYTVYKGDVSKISASVFSKAVPGVDGELCLNNLTNMLSGGSLDIDEDGDFDKSDIRLVITFYTYYTIYKGDVSKISASVFTKAVPGVDGEACLNKLISLLP